MIRLFLGLTAANLLLMAAVFYLGLAAVDGHDALTEMYMLHLTLGICGALVCALVHVAVYTYFMATCKWLAEAAAKAGLEPGGYVGPALRRKNKALACVMTAVACTLAALIGGAGTDPTVGRLWPGHVHLVLAMIAMAANLVAAVVEYGLIADQGKLMDNVLAILNHAPGVVVKNA